jgi:hypothetical protein
MANVAKATVLGQARSRLNKQVYRRLSVGVLKHSEFDGTP